MQNKNIKRCLLAATMVGVVAMGLFSVGYKYGNQPRIGAIYGLTASNSSAETAILPAVYATAGFVKGNAYGTVAGALVGVSVGTQGGFVSVTTGMGAAFGGMLGSVFGAAIGAA